MHTKCFMCATRCWKMGPPRCGCGSCSIPSTDSASFLIKLECLGSQWVLFGPVPSHGSLLKPRQVRVGSKVLAEHMQLMGLAMHPLEKSFLEYPTRVPSISSYWLLIYLPQRSINFPQNFPYSETSDHYFYLLQKLVILFVRHKIWKLLF